MIIDSHIHVDQISMRFGKKPFDVPFQSVVDHIKSNKIDAGVFIYRNYETLEKIQAIFPDLRIIGLYWVDIPVTKEDYISKSNEVQQQINRPLCYGIKLHNRGIFDQTIANQIVTSLKNLRVSDFNINTIYNYENKYILNLVKNLPNNSIVLCHTQGGSNSIRGAHTMTKMIVSCSHIKFLIGHAGSYGVRSVAVPDPFSTDKGLRITYIHEMHSMRSAIALAKSFLNVYLDNTVVDPVKIKGKLLNIVDNIVVGTDFGTSSNTYLLKTYEKIKKIFPNINIDSMNQRFLDWIDTDITKLQDRQIKINELTQNLFNNKKEDFI